MRLPVSQIMPPLPTSSGELAAQAAQSSPRIPDLLPIINTVYFELHHAVCRDAAAAAAAIASLAATRPISVPTSVQRLDE